MTKSYTKEDFKKIYDEVTADTPENRKRQELFAEFLKTQPGWKELAEQYGLENNDENNKT